jgi:cytochrome P450
MLSLTGILSASRTLMFAAMDTTSSALARILHLLSIHQDVQSKLRAEFREAHENFGDEPDHDQLVGLPYLDAICRETLRL